MDNEPNNKAANIGMINNKPFKSKKNWQNGQLKVIQISKYRGKCAVIPEMCECSKVHLFEVEFKLDGMTVVPTHKNCGFGLDEKQADKFQKELVKSWGFEEDED